MTSDPQSESETHNAMLEKSKRRLNAAHFTALRYKANNGTDLTVGLTSKHIWEGGAATTVCGVRFFPHIPTEEIFTTPDRSKTEAIVHSALPLVHAGKVVRDFWFPFEGGGVLDYDEGEGRDVLA